ncbi:MAG TPA: MBL fold metallo-hydrolase [Bryobacteraceae bacterium]|jgi:glyoxylase-like metal-dependent hydrolase (beta-lactamase superfamily II)|nr:MBL fold metallo-hydrolase [Bryobacteraceae bacterium]
MRLRPFARHFTLLLSMTALAGLVHAQQNQDFSKVQIHVLPVQGNVYMLVGAGGNITVQAGKDGVFLVDTMYAPLADKIVAAIRTISKAPIRYIVDTHVHADHTNGNELLRKAGSTITGGNVSADIKDSAEGAQIIAHQNILNRMSAAKGPDTAPSAAWPTDTYLTDEKDVFFNNEGIRVIHIPAAHTDGDSIVFFRRSDVISTGDLFTTTNYPVIDLDRGGSIQGFIAGLQKIVDMIIPVYGQEGGTMVVPGHGRLCDLGDVLEYREMAVIIRDRIQDMVGRGLTLEQVKAAKPTVDYDPLYGSTTGFWTTDKFVEAVYKSLKDGKK